MQEESRGYWHRIANGLAGEEKPAAQTATQHLLRRVVLLLRPYSAMLVVLLLLTAVTASLGVLEPLIYRAIIDDGISNATEPRRYSLGRLCWRRYLDSLIVDRPDVGVCWD